MPSEYRMKKKIHVHVNVSVIWLHYSFFFCGGGYLDFFWAAKNFFQKENQVELPYNYLPFHQDFLRVQLII